MPLGLFNRFNLFLAEQKNDRRQMAVMYRPLVRGYLLVAVCFYLIFGLVITPFLENTHISGYMNPLRVSVATVAASAFYLTRGTTSLRRLELAAVLINLHIFGNFFANELAEYRVHLLSNFAIIIILLGAVSPSLRVLAFSVAVSVAGWLWLINTQRPEFLRDHIFVAICSAVVASLIWGLINSALTRASRAVMTAERRGDELERFAYICSHDLQEPVRMINVYAGFLTENAEDRLDSEDQRYLGLVRKNALRIHHMIHDILRFSQVGREEIQMEWVNTNAVVAEVLSEFADLIQEKQARIICADLPDLETSPTLVRMIFYNLISNALKYQDNSRVPEVEITADLDGGLWRFRVRDNGIGIDPIHKEKVFTLFQRLNRKEDYPGTGIGLASCRKFIRLCGGDIDFESEPGMGATFVFTLPRMRVQPKAVA